VQRWQATSLQNLSEPLRTDHQKEFVDLQQKYENNQKHEKASKTGTNIFIEANKQYPRRSKGAMITCNPTAHLDLEA